jgi:hypothetical protein
MVTRSLKTPRLRRRHPSACELTCAHCNRLVPRPCRPPLPSTGCGGLRWNITLGLPGVRGARYLLNVWVAPSSGFLLPRPSGATAPTEGRRAPGSDAALYEFEAIMTIEPRRYFSDMNSTVDYSWLETPRLPPGGPPGIGGGANATANASRSSGGAAAIVRRARAPNPRMPAFIRGRLAWGSPPAPGAAGQQGAGGAAGGPGADASLELPPGSYCKRTPKGGGRVCGVSMTYCCFGTSAIARAVPQVLPCVEGGYSFRAGASMPTQCEDTPTY